MDQPQETAAEVIADLRAENEYLRTLHDLDTVAIEELEARNRHLIGELIKARSEPSYEPQLNVGS